jgi:hypothetical protein
MWLLPSLSVLTVASMLAMSAAGDLGHFYGDRLDRTCGGSAQNVLPLCFVRGWIVPEGFLTVQLEDIRSQEATLGVSLAAIEVYHQMDRTQRFRLRRRLCVCR